MSGNYFKKIRSKHISRIKIDILQGEVFTTLGEVFETFVDIMQILQWERMQPFGNLGINIGIDVGIGIAIAIFFFLRSFYFCLSKFLMKKTSVVKSFSSTLAHLPGSCSCCLEQLLCRKPVSTCF